MSNLKQLIPSGGARVPSRLTTFHGRDCDRVVQKLSRRRVGPGDERQSANVRPPLPESAFGEQTAIKKVADIVRGVRMLL